MRLLLAYLLAALLCFPNWVTLPYPVSIPDSGNFAGTSQQACTIDAAGEYCVLFATVPASGSITHVAFRTGTVTTPASLTITLETVGADANASGTLYGGSTAATLASQTSNTYYEVALGTPATGNPGELVATRITWTSTAGNLSINSVAGSSTHGGYMISYTGAVNKYQSAPFIRFRYGSDYPKMVIHPSITNQILFNSGSAVNMYGNQFTIVNPVRVIALTALMNYTNGGAYRMHILDANNNTVVTGMRDVDADQHTGQFGARVMVTPTILPAGTYKVVMEALNTSSAHGFYYWSHYSEAYLRQSSSIPEGWMYCERTSGGTWSTISSRVGLIGIVIDQIWSPSGGFASAQ